MKRLIFVITVFIAASTLAFAENDKPITMEQLPKEAKNFINQHFSKQQIALLKMESELFETSYEAIFTDGCKVEFDGKGAWKDVDCKLTQVPDNIIPEQIKKYINSNYKKANVLEIERDKRDYEVKLNNETELKFDLKFNLIDIDI